MSDIPKFFYQSWDEEIPKQILSLTMKHLPKDFIYKRFSLDDVRNYLLNNWGINYVNLYDSYNKIPHKIDLWRYCILYDTGGIYMDADCVLKSDLNQLLNYDAVFVTNIRGVQNIFNGFIITTAKNPIIKDIIEYMVIKGSEISNYYYNCEKLYTILKSYINLNHIIHEYITHNENFSNKKICVLLDKYSFINFRYNAYFNNTIILTETNSYYPYKKKIIRKYFKIINRK